MYSSVEMEETAISFKFLSVFLSSYDTVICTNIFTSYVQYRSKGLQHLHARKMRVVCV